MLMVDYDSGLLPTDQGVAHPLQQRLLGEVANRYRPVNSPRLRPKLPKTERIEN